jgi:hypothetical protein
VALFWSLTPHSTGPNETDSVRKAYILQVCAALLRKQKQSERSSVPFAAMPLAL